MSSTDIVQTGPAQTGGALAVRPDQTEWTPGQAAVLRQSGIKDEVSREELSSFLHLCQRTQLDPFSRQIYLIGRWDKRARREVYRPQTGIDGYRVIAHRAAAEKRESLGYEDTLWCDASGRWRDVWLPDEPPAAAKVVVVRNGQRFPAVARYREYVQTDKEGRPSGLWGKMSATMTAKCAESLALRMAFPHDLAGVYTAEEMGQADSQAPHLRSVAPQQSEQSATSSQLLHHREAGPVPKVSERAQEIANAAAKAKHRGEWRPQWGAATGTRLAAALIKAPDTGQIDELCAYLTRLGTILPEQGQVPQQVRDFVAEARGAANADQVWGILQDAEAAGLDEKSLGHIAVVGKSLAAGPPSPKPGDTDTNGEVVDDATDEAQAEAAEKELRSFGDVTGLPDIGADFERAKGLPLEQATATQIRGFLAELSGTAA